MPVCFIMRHRKGVDPDGRGDEKELGGVEEGKTLRKIHCLKNCIFNKRINFQQSHHCVINSAFTGF